jgi:hypothetical protein
MQPAQLKTQMDGIFQWLPLLSVFRQGDVGSSWYAVLGGQLDVRLEQPSKDANGKVRAVHVLGSFPSSHFM